MAKPDNPLLSLGARGTVGGTLTVQRRGRGHIARSKPSPTDPYTLPQAYQRWLYQDYVSYWQDQTPAQKQAWETAARPLRITGFSYWMKSYLSTLPDLAGAWRFDKLSAGTTPDFSRNSNPGIVFGASITPGLIDGALSFDGVDDKVSIPHTSLLSFAQNQPFTIQFSAMTTGVTYQSFIRKVLGNHYNYDIYLNAAAGNVVFQRYDGTFNPLIRSSTLINDGIWHHFACLYNPTDDKLHLFIDGLEDTSPVTDTSLDTTNSAPVLLATGQGWLSGLIDQPIIYNRALTARDIFRHALRSYPP